MANVAAAQGLFILAVPAAASKARVVTRRPARVASRSSREGRRGMAGPSALNDQAIDLLHGLLVDGSQLANTFPTRNWRGTCGSAPCSLWTAWVGRRA
jgi:hypothetical protein